MEQDRGDRAGTLHGADLRGADLRGANLQEANLRGADLRGAALCGANLRGANLRGANLSWANLQEANLCGADLCGADVRETQLLDGGCDGRGYRFLGHYWQEQLRILAGCRYFTVEEARNHWGAPSYAGGRTQGQACLVHVECIVALAALFPGGERPH